MAEDVEKAASSSRTASASSSRTSSRVSTAKSRPGTSKSRKSRPPSAFSLQRGATAAGNVVRSLSRPSTARSVAWSDPGQDEEKKKDPEDEEAPPPHGLSRELEEELNRGAGDPTEQGNEPIGCWTKFTRMVSSLWDTTDMQVGEETEVIVRTTLREGAIYVVFLAILCIVTLSAMTPTMFRYTDMIKKQFASAASVAQITDFWQFLEGDFVDGIFNEQWYNEGDMRADFPCPDGHNATTKAPCPIDPEDRKILYANRLLGVPRLRQLRVSNSSCVVPVLFKDAIKVCYDHYSTTIEDTSDFFPSSRKYTSADAWRYQSVKELDGNTHRGRWATYSGAGSIQNLQITKEESLAIIKELREGLWLGRGTRYVSIDFTIYNANVNLFCVIKMNFEFQPTGGISPHIQFGTVKLLRYVTPEEYAIMAVEFVFAAFLIYYLVEEILEIKNLRLEYFLSFWNCLDLFVILISIATVSFNVYCFLAVSSLLKGLLAEPDLWADFSFLETWSKTFQDAAALTVFVGWVKVFKYISFNKTMAQLAGTINRCAADVIGFSVMFFIVFCAYAQVGYLMFGVHMKDFSTFTNACYTQQRLILGDFDFPAIEKSHRFWGPVYFVSYVFLVYFILMNMFLAIINDTYSEVKEEVDNRKEDFQVGDLVMRGYNNLREKFHERDKLVDIKETVKLASDDGVVTFDEVRDSLRRLNFSDLEIEIFVAKYDKDGNFEFSLEEINAIEQGLGDQFDNYDHLRLDGGISQAANTASAASSGPKMTKAQLHHIEHRVNHMEKQMTQVITKVDEALIKLEQIEPVRSSSALAKGVRNIASAKGDDETKKKQLQALVESELKKVEEEV